MKIGIRHSSSNKSVSSRPIGKFKGSIKKSFIWQKRYRIYKESK